MNRIAALSSLLIIITVPLGLFQSASSTSRVTDESSSVSLEAAEYIVQAESLQIAAKAVEAVGGEITHELGIINGVGAILTSGQLEQLEVDDRLKIQADRSTRIAGHAPSTFYPTLAGAADLHKKGIIGSGVTVAVLDSGFFDSDEVSLDPYGRQRVLAQYDATNGKLSKVDKKSGRHDSTDKNGHGSHVTSVILNSKKDAQNGYAGVAPGVNLVTVRAFKDNGDGKYLDVIRGLDWISRYQATYGIRVVNLSFSADVQSHYWDDPINQAVMALWQQGIVVVASAGNNGPDAMTIGVPGNNPYVITVGAMTDEGTPYFSEDDHLASFSAAGPTAEGFVKPDIVAPGGRIIGVMDAKKHEIAKDHPEYLFKFGDDDDDSDSDDKKSKSKSKNDGAYFEMSGTSQSAAVVTGVVALMLDAEPNLNPDQVKCKLISSARPAALASGDLAYSVFQQGAGLVNAYGAVESLKHDCANVGMDINMDLTGQIHYGGPANVDEYGNYYIMGLDGYMWTNGYVWTNGDVRSDGYIWTNGYVWTDGYLWTNAYLWTDCSIGIDGYLWTNGYVWTNGYLWTDGYLWTNGFLGKNNNSERASINTWVDPE